MKTGLHHFFDLLWGMTEKELRARYKHTVFGFLWLILNPILQMLVIGFVFTLFVKEPVEHYYYYLFIGLLVWNFFSTSLNKATPSIVYERALIKKAIFPHETIPLSIILSNFVHFSVAFVLLIIPISFLKTIRLETLPYLFIAISLLIIFCVGISLLTSALNVRFRDISFFTQAILVVWFYATPIIYSLAQVPADLHWVWRLNPLTSILQIFHFVLLGTSAPDWTILLSNTCIIALITVIGIIVFRVKSPNFDDWI